MPSFKPMLAGKAPSDLESLSYPLYVSPKLDGIRCLILDGQAVTRSLKLVPNKHIRDTLVGLPHGLDGELMLRQPASYNDIQSAVMSQDGEPDFVYCVFDWTSSPGFRDYRSYNYRFNELWANRKSLESYHAKVVPHRGVHGAAELLEAERDYLAEGHEGLMIRSTLGLYKWGRSTTKQGWLLKLKRFEDAEATVVRVEEQMHNANEAEEDNLGHTKRSTKKAGLVPNGKLGSLVCLTPEGVEFSIGTGFTDATRCSLWAEKGKLSGRVVTYKHQPDPNDSDIAPRFPVFLHFRRD